MANLVSPCRRWVSTDDGLITDSWTRGFHSKYPKLDTPPIGFFSPIRFHTDIDNEAVLYHSILPFAQATPVSVFNINFLYACGMSTSSD